MDFHTQSNNSSILSPTFQKINQTNIKKTKTHVSYVVKETKKIFENKFSYNVTILMFMFICPTVLNNSDPTSLKKMTTIKINNGKKTNE